MPPLQGFASGFYESRSKRWDAQRLENLYNETSESKTSQSPAALYGAAGLKALAQLPTQPVRGMWAGDNRLFAVGGSKLYEVFLRAGALNTSVVGGVAKAHWVSGPLFDKSWVGTYLTIGNLTYKVTAVDTTTSAASKDLTLEIPAGTQNGVAYEGSMTWGLRGEVGDDSEHSPVRMFSNGNQLFIVSAERAYVSIGAIATGFATVGTGSPSTSVTYVSGDKFRQAMAGQVITIDGADYEIASVNPEPPGPNGVVLKTVAPDASDKPFTVWYTIPAPEANGSGTVTALATNVTWKSGNLFESSLVGNPFWISGEPYVVDSVTDPKNLVLTYSAGTQDAPAYSAIPKLEGFATVNYKVVHLVGGDDFVTSMSGQKITLGGADYTVDPAVTVTASSLTLTANAMSRIHWQYVLDMTGQVTTNGKVVTWVSGDKFDQLLAGEIFTINDVDYTVDYVTDDGTGHNTGVILNLTSDAGTQDGGVIGGVPNGVAYHTLLPERNHIIDISTAIVGGAPLPSNVTWVEWDPFPYTLFAKKYKYNGYTVATWTDQYNLILDKPLVLAYSGNLPARSGAVTTSGTGVRLVSGTPPFDDLLIKQTITISGVNYTVQSVTDGANLVLEKSAGTQDYPPYTATKPLKAKMGAYIDSKFIAQLPDSNAVVFSAPKDGLVQWNTDSQVGDIGTKDGSPDRLLAIWADHNELYLMGYETGEVWDDTGGGAAAGFERNPSGTMQQGISAPWSFCSLDNGVAWIGEDVRGRGVAYLARGYQPVRISTHAVENAWQQYGTTQDAEGYSYQEEGHNVWVIHFPGANATWQYDETENVWAERTSQYLNGSGTVTTSLPGGIPTVTWVSGDHFDPSMAGNLFTIDGIDYRVASVTSTTVLVLTLDPGIQTAVEYKAWVPGRQRQRCHAFAFQRHLVGDWQTGTIYEQSIEFLDDDGAPIQRTRTCPHLSQEQLNIFYHRLQLEMEVAGGWVSYTDLFIDSGDNHRMTSLAHRFTNDDIGRYLNITGGTGFTVQRVRIVAVNGQGVATASKALGTVASTGGIAAPDIPQVTLELSRDGGKTWGPPHQRSPGMDGETIKRVIWNRLGYARDRVFRITSTARIRHAWLAADLSLTGGNA